MGNVPSTEEDTTTTLPRQASADGESRAVTFSTPPKDRRSREDDEDNNQEEEKEEEKNNNDDADSAAEQDEFTDPPPPRRNLADSMGKQRSSYFDLVRGRRVTAEAPDERAEMRWRNSNKSIRVMSADRIGAPAPYWTRTMRKLGVLDESKRRLDVVKASSGHQQDKPSDDSSSPPPPPADASLPNRTMRHFRIQSKASQRDRSSVLLDNTKTASVVSEYLRWTFRKTFLKVFVAVFLQFFFLCTLFAVFIYIVDLEQPQCISGGTRLDNGNGTIAFGDAFHLSWTTLSTVGYGVISPSLAEVDDEDTRCLGLNALMAVEAFIGVLFGGVTGAIIFGKIARVQSMANVRFSDPVLIRYGLGVVGTGDNDKGGDDDDDQEDKNDKEKKDVAEGTDIKVEWPCPVLEFRIVNELSDRVGGEIMNATINVAACSLEKLTVSEEYAALRGALLAKKNKKKRKRNTSLPKSPKGAVGLRSSGVGDQTGKAILGGSREAAHAAGNLIQKLNHGLNKSLHHHRSNHSNSETGSQGEDEAKPFNAAKAEREMKQQIAIELADAAQQQQAVTVDEGSHTLAPRRIYFKLEIETDSHPFFKRVWNIRHVLNEDSPLLSPVARRTIVENDGNWPNELNNHKSIRKHVLFEELVVSLAGTSNVSGSSVYAQKIYDYGHLNIGYSFAPVLALDSAGAMVVDHRLLNDVKEQAGGGGERIEGINQTAVGTVQAAERLGLDSSRRLH